MNIQGRALSKVEGNDLKFARFVLAHRLRRDRARVRVFNYGVGKLGGYPPPMEFSENLYRTVMEMAGNRQVDTLVWIASSIAMSAISNLRNRLTEIIHTVKTQQLSLNEKRMFLIEADNIQEEIAELVSRMEAISD